MKKKVIKKLVLNRETLIELDRNDLWPAGGFARTQPPICQASGRNTCTTCGPTCTTNLC